MYHQFKIQQLYALPTLYLCVLYLSDEQTETCATYSINWLVFIRSFSSLSYDRSKASSKASSPHSAIQSFLLQMRVSSPFLKVIQ